MWLLVFAVLVLLFSMIIVICSKEIDKLEAVSAEAFDHSKHDRKEKK